MEISVFKAGEWQAFGTMNNRSAAHERQMNASGQRGSLLIAHHHSSAMPERN